MTYSKHFDALFSAVSNSKFYLKHYNAIKSYITKLEDDSAMQVKRDAEYQKTILKLTQELDEKNKELDRLNEKDSGLLKLLATGNGKRQYTTCLDGLYEQNI